MHFSPAGHWASGVHAPPGHSESTVHGTLMFAPPAHALKQGTVVETLQWLLPKNMHASPMGHWLGIVHAVVVVTLQWLLERRHRW